MPRKKTSNNENLRSSVIITTSNILFIPVKIKDLESNFETTENIAHDSERQMVIDGIIESKERAKSIEKNVIRLFEKELNRRHKEKRKKVKESKDSTDISVLLNDNDTYETATSLYSLLSSETGLNNSNLDSLLEDMLIERQDISFSFRNKGNNGFDENNIAHVNISACISNESNNVHCWWDTQPFQTPAIGIPVTCNITDEKVQFMTHGVFCSYNCALSYLIQYSEKWYYFDTSLLHFMKRLLENNKDTITRAPDKLLLNIFGGPMNISQYRSKFIKRGVNTTHTQHPVYKISLPPLIPIIPKIHMNDMRFINQIGVVSRGNNEGNGCGGGNQNSDELILKRSKPLPKTKTGMKMWLKKKK